MASNKWSLDGVFVDAQNNMTVTGNMTVNGNIKPAGGQVYDVTAPAVDVRTFNPATATINDLYDFVATLAKDLVG